MEILPPSSGLQNQLPSRSFKLLLHGWKDLNPHPPAGGFGDLTFEQRSPKPTAFPLIQTSSARVEGLEPTSAGWRIWRSYLRAAVSKTN
ncbi:MAG: hypothetical protein PVI44_09355, partial [Balneolaceae bacterium]